MHIAFAGRTGEREGVAGPINVAEETKLATRKEDVILLTGSNEEDLAYRSGTYLNKGDLKESLSMFVLYHEHYY